MILELIASAICVILTLFSIYLSSLYYQKIARRLKYPLHAMFLFYIIFIGLLFFQFLPSVLRIFSGWKYEKLAGVLEIEVAVVYLLEFISFSVWIVATYQIVKFFTLCRNNKVTINKYISLLNLHKAFSFYGEAYGELIVNDNHKTLMVKILMVSFMFGSFLVTFYSIYNPNVTLVLDWLLRPLLVHGGEVLAIVSIIIGKRFYGIAWYPKVFMLSWLILIPSIATGSHGNIISLVIYLSVSFFFIQRSKLMGIILVSGLLLVGIFNDQLHSMRAELQFQEDVTLGQRLDTFLNSKSESSDSSLLDKMEFRFGENSRVSVGYLRMVDAGNNAKLNAIINSFYGFLPRSIYPDKPYSGSADGTKYGAGMYQIHREINGRPYNMSGFLTGLHAYWEYGIMFVIVSALFSACYTAFILLFSDKFGVLGLSLVILHIDTWWQMPKLWVSEIVLQLIGYVGVFMLFLFLLNLASRKLKV